MLHSARCLSRFFSNVSPTPGLYPLSLHDALPISATYTECSPGRMIGGDDKQPAIDEQSTPLTGRVCRLDPARLERSNKIGRAHGLNSSHVAISYAVFCLKKKKRNQQ